MVRYRCVNLSRSYNCYYVKCPLIRRSNPNWKQTSELNKKLQNHKAERTIVCLILKSRRLIKVVFKSQVKGSEIFAFLKRFTADENVPITVEKEVGEALGFQLLLEWNNWKALVFIISYNQIPEHQSKFRTERNG